MQLDRILAGRFASHHSPTRERRELGFASPTPTGPNADDGAPKLERDAGLPEGVNKPEEAEGAHQEARIQAGRLEHSARTKSVLSGIDLLTTLEYADIYKSADLADYLVYTNRINDKELEAVAKTVGIRIDDPAQKDLPVYARILRNTKPEQKAALIAAMGPIVHEQLKENPEVTLRGVWQLHERIKKHKEFQASLESMLRIDAQVVELQSEILNAQDDTARNVLENGTHDDPIVEKLEQKLREIIKREVRTQGGKFEEAINDHFRNIERLEGRTLTNEERSNMRIDAMTEITYNAQKKLRTTKNTGGAQPGETKDPQGAYEKPDHYIEKLEKQERGMRALLDAQVRERALTTFGRHLERFNDLLKKINIPGITTIAEAQAILRDGELKAAPEGSPPSPEQKKAQQLEQRFLAQHGVSVIVVLKDVDQMFRELKRQCRMQPAADAAGEDRYTLPPTIDDDAFLEEAKEGMTKWEKRQDDLKKDPEKPESADADLRRMQTEQADTERWAFEMSKAIEEIDRELPDGKAWEQRLDGLSAILNIPEAGKETFVAEFKNSLGMLRQYSGKKTAAERAALRRDLGNCITSAGFPPDKQRNIERCLGMLRNKNTLTKAVDDAKVVNERMTAETKDKAPEVKDTAIENICNITRQRLDQIIGVLLPVRPNTNPDDKIIRRDVYQPMQHEITLFLQIDGALRGRQTQLIQQLEAASANRQKNPEAALRSALWAESEVKKLWKCKDMMDEIKQKEESAPDLPDNVLAEYDRTRCVIRINTNKSSSEIAAARKHEQGHALLHILTERAGIFPNLVSSTYEAHAERRDAQGRSFKDLLLSLNDYGSYRHLERQNLEEDVKLEAFTEELLVRYADWKSGRRKQDQGHFHLNELALFRMLDQRDTKPQQKNGAADDLANSTRRLGKLASFHSEEGEGEAPDRKEIFPMKEYMAESERALQNIKQFLAAYANESDQLPRDIYDMVKEHHAEADGEQQDLEKKFQNQALWTNGLPPEKNPDDQDRVKKLSEFAGKLEKLTRSFDAQRLDTTKEERSVGMWDRMTGGVNLLSINDVIKLWSDTWEDLQSIYKRKQDRLLKDVGYAITKPLQDSPLVKMIPGVNGYLPGLHAYHQRRYSSTEVEAADKWKDGMKNEDSHSLLHFIHTTKNKDAVRGIISLLCDRGEMDWNDKDVWKTLNALSGYNMPEGPCLRSDVLRDTWLRKIISYIWNDKELYYHWRSENDSKTKSGKEHFTPWVDQLSNVKDGMRSELHKQLKLYTEWNTPPHHGTPPEDVKPHLYEKVLHYAISNGKMTMEDKFYYLIRGVAAGILSIDRLRTLAGEEGGVLNQFGFIDYFYGRHNSLPEIQALARRLTEKENDKDTFKPGSNTTLWIQLELVRDPGVQARVSKGTSRTSAETIDHEDVPLFVPQLDYNGVRNMANVISGSRQKMSPEALKNLYCGYSSKFKVFARLAQLEDKGGLDRFTAEDASMFADSIAAYVDVDNILTRKAYESDSRPTLTRTQMNQMAVSGDGAHSVLQYRRNMHRFIARLVKKLKASGADIEKTDEWKTFQKQYKKTEQKKEDYLKPDGTIGQRWVAEQNFSIDDLVTKEGEEDQLKSNKAETARKLFEGTKYFVDALKKLLPQNLQILKETLKEAVESGENGFFDEGGSSAKGGLTYEKAVIATEARNEQRRFQLQLEAAGGH